MIFTCEDCGFIFCRIGEVMECPSCEKKHIRSAAEEEAQRLLELLEQEIFTLQIEEVQSL
jgi:uncharacterized Zn finger protein (UPF0148 family)